MSAFKYRDIPLRREREIGLDPLATLENTLGTRNAFGQSGAIVAAVRRSKAIKCSPPRGKRSVEQNIKIQLLQFTWLSAGAYFENLSPCHIRMMHKFNGNPNVAAMWVGTIPGSFSI